MKNDESLKHDFGVIPWHDVMPRQRKESWPSIRRPTALGRPSTSSPRPAPACAGPPPQAAPPAATPCPPPQRAGLHRRAHGPRRIRPWTEEGGESREEGGERRAPGEGGGTRTREEARRLPQGRRRAPATVRELDRCRCRSAPAAARPADRLPSAGSLRVFRLSLRPDPNSPQFLISDPLKPPTLAAGGAGGRAIRQAAERQAMGVPAAP